MPAWLPLLHAILAAAWLGCVLTETVFERLLLAQGPALHGLLGRLHRRVDLAIELPALMGVAASGAWMLAVRGGAMDHWLEAKITIGLIAIAANLWCIRLVLRRCTQALAGDEAGFAASDRAQHRWGAVVLLGLLASFILALLRSS
jgi:uncharacterized membrane protein